MVYGKSCEQAHLPWLDSSSFETPRAHSYTTAIVLDQAALNALAERTVGDLLSKNFLLLCQASNVQFAITLRYYFILHVSVLNPAQVNF